MAADDVAGHGEDEPQVDEAGGEHRLGDQVERREPGERRVVDRLLSAFFQDYKAANFRKAVATLCRFYHLRHPRVEWSEYIDWGKTAGKTYENGQIYLVHPENWKKGRKYNSERRWISTVYHEMGHYVFWADAENKADMFAARMVRGLNHHK